LWLSGRSSVRITSREPDVKRPSLQRDDDRGARMPIQRKVFRIERMNGAPAAETEQATAAPEPSDILAELKTLQNLIQRQTGTLSKADPGTLEPNGLRQLKDETDTIHRAILHTKQEIATLHAGTFTDGKPRATRELDAVVDGTERATQQILDAAEVIEE